MNVDWRQEDGQPEGSLYTDYNGTRYWLRQGEDGLIRLSSDQSRCICTWDGWEAAKSDAEIAIKLRVFMDDPTTHPGWQLYRELIRRDNYWAYQYGDCSWRARYFNWRSECYSREENLAKYKIVAALHETATVEEVARAINVPMFGPEDGVQQ